MGKTILLTALLFLQACRTHYPHAPMSEQMPSAGTPGQPPSQISIRVSKEGIFDPSVADTGVSGRTWMSYSAVDPSPRWPAVNMRTITTRLAYSDDHGRTWRDAGGRVNDIRDLQGGKKEGTWVNEVSSLLFDPTAAPPQQWQLYWHHYLSVHDKGEFTNGWIGLKTASSPEGLATAKEIKLFAGRIYDKADNDATSSLQPPVSGAPVLQLDRMAEQLHYCLALTEPAAVATTTGVYLAMVCVEPRAANPLALLATPVLGTSSKIVLLKCASPCQPDSPTAWKYVNTVATSDDAKSFGAIGLSAPDIFLQNGRAYLLVSPESNSPVKGAYNGCLLARFADLQGGVLDRSADGRIVILRHIEGRPNTFNGACTYQPSIEDAGFLYGEIRFESKPIFELYETGPVIGKADF